MFWAVLSALFLIILRNSQLESAVCRNHITWSLNSRLESRLRQTWIFVPCDQDSLYLSLTSTKLKIVASRYFIRKNCFGLFLSAHFLFWEFYQLESDVCRKRTLNPFNSMVSENHVCVSRINFHFNRYRCFLCTR